MNLHHDFVMVFILLQDSKFGGQVRSGKDYYQAWDKFAEKASAAGDSDDEEAAPQKASVPKPHSKEATGVASAAPAPIPARGPALTERLIAVNAGLTKEEKEI